MRVTLAPGSTISASRVTGSAMMEQLHCNIRTGMVIWIIPWVAAFRADRPSFMKGSILSEMKGFSGGAAWFAALFDRLSEGGFADTWKWLPPVQLGTLRLPPCTLLRARRWAFGSAAPCRITLVTRLPSFAPRETRWR